MSRSGLRSTRPLTAADAVCRTLEGLGVRHVFGLPGGQNIDMTESLRRSGLEWVVPTHELAAAFAANGYWRSSGRPGVMSVIPGPGFTFALTGLAEAKLDSTALLAITGVRPEGASGPGLQEIPQERMAAPILERSFRVSSAGDLPGTVARAYRATTAGEPGPVLVQVEHPLWSESCRPGAVDAALEGGNRPEEDDGRGGSPSADVMEELRSRLSEASRPVLLVGQGAQEAAGELVEFAETLGAPTLVTTSGRGAIPDSHPLALPLDRLPEALERAEGLFREADLAFVLGCRLGYNATLGGRLALPSEKLVRVDASAAVMEESGPRASLQVAGDAAAVLRSLLPGLERRERGGDGGRGEPWWRQHAGTIPEPGSGGLGDVAEPRVEEGGGAVADFFAGLREAMPDDGCLVTDSGLHQMLARKHLPIESPRGLVVPTNFQSMGYGVPAAIGAALARPRSTVVALVGDGGLRLSALDLATAKSLGVDLTVVVFADGYYGLIRRGQLSDYGRGSGVELPEVDIGGLCASMDVDHVRVGSAPGPELRERLRAGGVGVVEVGLRDSTAFRLGTARGEVRRRLRRLLGPDGVERVKQMLSTWRGWFGESASGD